MKRFLNTLFYSCFKFQVKVGNGNDDAVFSTSLMFLVAILLYATSIMHLISWGIYHLTDNRLPTNTAMIIVYCIVAIWGVIWYFTVIYKGQYRKLIENPERITTKDKVVSFSLFLGSFIFCILVFSARCAYNNGIFS